MCKANTVSLIISDAKCVIGYFKKSGKNSQLKTTLKSMIDTRWNYVYDSFVSLINNFEQVVQILLENNELSKLGRITKDHLNDITQFLFNFKAMTKAVEDENTFNLHIAYQKFYKLIDLLQENDVDSEAIASMKAEGRGYIYINSSTIKDDFKPSLYHNAAAFLHPLMKNMRKSTNEERDKTHQFIKNELSANSANNGHAIQQVAHNDIEEEFYDDFDAHETDEYTRYKTMTFSTIDAVEFDLKAWWMKHKSLFPQLYKIFIKLQSLPSSSASAERRFSQSSHLLTDLRTRLTPQMVKNLLICKDFHFQYNE